MSGLVDLIEHNITIQNQDFNIICCLIYIPNTSTATYYGIKSMYAMLHIHSDIFVKIIIT